MAGMDLRRIVLDFYDRNCKGCDQRLPGTFPNLSILVAERDRASKLREENAQVAAEYEGAEIEARSKRRATLSTAGNGANAGIFDIIDRLDHTSDHVEKNILVETAKAVPERFDAEVQSALLELADVGGWTRTEAALESLMYVECNRVALTTAALQALARFEAVHVAGVIVGKWLQQSHKEHLLAAVPALVHLAAPRRIIGLPYNEALSAETVPLMAAYNLFPEIVYYGLRDLLQCSDKTERFRACKAIKAIIQHDPDFGLQIANDLIRSLTLPDDPYDEGYAGSAATEALAGAMLFRPVAIDEIIQKALGATSDPIAARLFEVFTTLLRDLIWPEGERDLCHADELVFKRIVDTLLSRPNDNRFRDAAIFVRDHVRYLPMPLLQSQTDSLLGAAALIAEDLEKPYSFLLDQRPSEVKNIEAYSRETHLSIGIDATSEALGFIALQKPKELGAQIVQTLQNLGEQHTQFRRALVRALGIFGHSREGLPIVLPALYSSMMDISQIVRAEAARAYGEIAKRVSDDLPHLVHQSFLVLLSDPFCIVHSSAIEALREVDFPSSFRHELIRRLLAIIHAYTMKKNDRLLSACIKLLISVSNDNDSFTPAIINAIIPILDGMNSYEAGRLIKYCGDTLRVGPGYGDLLCKILQDHETYMGDVGHLLQELSMLPADEINRLGEEIQKVEKVGTKHRVQITPELLEILSSSGEWPKCVETAGQAVQRFEDTQWDRPRKLRALMHLRASELELAAAEQNTVEVLDSSKRLQGTIQEIIQDEKDNEQVRSPLYGILR
jgi:hypothetical protein